MKSYDLKLKLTASLSDSGCLNNDSSRTLSRERPERRGLVNGVLAARGAGCACAMLAASARALSASEMSNETV